MKNKLCLLTVSSFLLATAVGCGLNDRVEDEKKVTYQNQGAHFNTPLIYLMDNELRVAEIKNNKGEKVKTFAGISFEYGDSSPVAAIAFKVAENNKSQKSLSIEAYDSKKQPKFCDAFALKINESQNAIEILKNNPYYNIKLPKQITCSYKLKSSKAKLQDNRLDVSFNHTIGEWLHSEQYLNNLNGLSLNLKNHASKDMETLNLSDFKDRDGKPVQITTLSPITALINLKELTASNMKGVDIPDLSNLDKLEFLDLSMNDLTEIPPSIKWLKNLKSLNLGQNKIKEIPEFLTKMKSLEVVILQNNEIKEIPESTRKWLDKLKVKNLDGNVGQATQFK
ncbi:leucine-rich repeat domain-containing protein [Fluviispira multicolorata]|uniref:Leucine rich repeat-containing protein n=1 Tax=Fluviispira multicolorata TaxID=2654512 RepID=A0A833N365_9BACT|nr:leucine-rich repeat domain-containing protein [Fluviispira multicolorata]KAB8027969.1 hypothetical protein GCL57_13015 [Fluviispira multicolorata]